MSKSAAGVLLVCVAVLAPGRLAAQTSSTTWNHSLMVYMLGAAMDGTITVGPAAGDVDVSFSDIASNLELGGMASYRGERGDFAVLGDVIFMGLGATKTGAHDAKVDVDVDQWVVEIDAAWRLGSGFELLAGARYVSLATDVSVSGPLADRQADVTKEWVDPVVGLQMRTPLGRGWSFVGRVDVGGFRVGSDFAWQAVAGVRVGLSPGSSLLLAYRAIDVDYESRSGADYFRYDMLTQGPMVGFSLKL